MKAGDMKIGALYRSNAHQRFAVQWAGKVALYLGEEIFNRSDGVTIVNHKFLLGADVRVTDKTFLKYMEEIQT